MGSVWESTHNGAAVALCRRIGHDGNSRDHVHMGFFFFFNFLCFALFFATFFFFFFALLMLLGSLVVMEIFKRELGKEGKEAEKKQQLEEEKNCNQQGGGRGVAWCKSKFCSRVSDV